MRRRRIVCAGSVKELSGNLPEAKKYITMYKGRGALYSSYLYIFTRFDVL